MNSDFKDPKVIQLMVESGVNADGLCTRCGTPDHLHGWRCSPAAITCFKLVMREMERRRLQAMADAG